MGNRTGWALNAKTRTQTGGRGGGWKKAEVGFLVLRAHSGPLAPKGSPHRGLKGRGEEEELGVGGE